jgi:glycosyltransferase involved in cell wall biosynthesis
VTEASRTHLVLIPSFNPGPKVYDTVREARAQWAPVWVVVDGSDDGTAQGLQQMAREDAQLRVIVLPYNQGKGSAVLHGATLALSEGFTHALTMDSDGQHPAWLIADFMRTSIGRPEALVLGMPIFDASAPRIRVNGRKLSNWWTDVETLNAGIGDSLYGFRIYPLADLVAVMGESRWMRRFDFDPEVAIRLVWRGLPPINIDAPVKYLKAHEGGVSHFNYLRDNVLLSWMHTRLVFGFLARLPALVRQKRRLARSEA